MKKRGNHVFFENLDAIRYFCFLVVFLFHVGFYEYISSLTGNVVVRVIARLLASGGWGVSFFFVLSGFLITWLMLNEQDKNGKISVKDFYIRRVLRIWPLYYLVFFIGAVAFPALYRHFGISSYFDYDLVYYATFLSNVGKIMLDSTHDAVRSIPLVMNISWSVSIEEQFYLIWPLCFVFLARDKWKYIFPAFIIISVVLATIYHADKKILDNHTFIRIGEIAIGAWIAHSYYHNKKIVGFLQRANKPVIALFYIIPFLLIAFSFYFNRSIYIEYLLRLVVCVCFGMIILEQNFSSRSILKFGRFRIASRLGKISYGLYMLHPIAIVVCSYIFDHQLKALPFKTPVMMVAALLLTIGISYLSYELYEKHFLKLKNRFNKI